MEERQKARTATDTIKSELAGMDVGDIVLFPLEDYNPSSVRSTPAAMMEQRGEGWKWMSKMDFDDKCVYVVRIK